MKNYIILICSILMATTLYAKKPKVVATASMLADMTKNIAGDLVELETIVPIGGDPHLHEPTPRDAKLVVKADLIIKNGLTFEGWLNKLIKSAGTKATVVTTTQDLTPLVDELHGESPDPHAWMNVKHAILYSRNITNALIELMPKHKDTLEANYLKYEKQLEELDAYILKQALSVPKDKRVVITSHDAFRYYGERYDFKLEAMVGTSTEAEAKTSDLIRLQRIIREQKIPAIFVESTINPKLLKQVAQDNDIVIGGELYADSLGEEGKESGTYIGMMKHNTDVIVAALNRKVEPKSTEKEEVSASGGNMWMYLGIGGLLIVGLGVLVRKIG